MVRARSRGPSRGFVTATYCPLADPDSDKTATSDRDVDAACAKVRDGGGAVYAEPFDVPQVGRIAIIADPTGGAIGVYTPDGDPPSGPEAGTPGSVSWRELARRNRRRGSPRLSAMKS